MDEVSQERVDDAWDEGFAHGYSAAIIHRIEDAKIVRLRKILSTVLETCEDVNSPDRKVREEITRTVRKALKEKE